MKTKSLKEETVKKQGIDLILEKFILALEKSILEKSELTHKIEFGNFSQGSHKASGTKLIKSYGPNPNSYIMNEEFMPEEKRELIDNFFNLIRKDNAREFCEKMGNGKKFPYPDENFKKKYMLSYNMRNTEVIGDKETDVPRAIRTYVRFAFNQAKVIQKRVVEFGLIAKSLDAEKNILAKTHEYTLYQIFFLSLIMTDEEKLKKEESNKDLVSKQKKSDNSLGLEQVKCDELLKGVIARSEENLFMKPIFDRIARQKKLSMSLEK